MVNTSYYLEHLRDHFYSNEKQGRIKSNVNGILNNDENGLIQIEPRNVKVFKKILSRMLKYDQGYWDKENWEFKLLFFALKI